VRELREKTKWGKEDSEAIEKKKGEFESYAVIRDQEGKSRRLGNHSGQKGYSDVVIKVKRKRRTLRGVNLRKGQTEPPHLSIQ